MRTCLSRLIPTAGLALGLLGCEAASVTDQTSPAIGPAGRVEPAGQVAGDPGDPIVQEREPGSSSPVGSDSTAPERTTPAFPAPERQTPDPAPPEPTASEPTASEPANSDPNAEAPPGADPVEPNPDELPPTELDGPDDQPAPDEFTGKLGYDGAIRITLPKGGQ